MKQKLLCVISLVTALCAGAHAQSYEGDDFFDANPGNAIHKYSTYLKTNAQEHINPATGALTIVATDISLPGRNGLDLNINRVYRGRTRVAMNSYGNPHKNYSDVDFVPQWSNLGMGWKCFIAVFVKRLVTYGGNNYYLGELHLGDGSVVEFWDSNPGNTYTTYYAKGPEKYKIVFENRNGTPRPVLYMPNGMKYFFDHKPNVSIWGFRGDHYWVTSLEDNNGNNISVSYYPHYDQATGQFTNWDTTSTEIAQIKDTWGRRIYFYWTPDRPGGANSYPDVGSNPKMKLSSIQIAGVGGGSDGNLQQTWLYLYDTLTVSDTLKHMNWDGSSCHTWYNKFTVSTLSAVFCNDTCITRYKYGRKTSGPDRYDNTDNKPNADRGQLIKVLYPSGACDTYNYSLEADNDPWTDANIYSVVRKKGNANNGSLWTFEYEPNDIVSSDPFPGRMNGGFWMSARVTNIEDSNSTSYVYTNSENFLVDTHYGNIPLLWYSVDSIFDGNSSFKKTVYTRDKVVFNGLKKAHRVTKVETYIKATNTSKIVYNYPDPCDLYNYDNILTKNENDNERRTEYTYLHNGQYATKYRNAWILDRTDTIRVYDSGGVLRSFREVKYDDIPCSTYNFPGDSIPNHNPAYYPESSTLARGNPTTSKAYQLDGSGNVIGYLTDKTKYDVCGNPVVTVNANGDSTWYCYSEALGGSKTTINDTIYVQYGPTPNALWKTTNQEYGVHSCGWNYRMGPKSMEWTSQGDTVLYGYENIYLRPAMMIKRGDNKASPTVRYEYQDRDPYYTEWNNKYIPTINQTPPSNPIIFTKETSKQNSDAFNLPVYRYYDRNGYLKSQVQGNIENNYTLNSQGLLTSETAPHFTGQPSPPTTRYFYDGLKRLKKILHPDGSQTNYAYGPLWRSVTDGNGRTTKYDFDKLGRLVKVTDAAGGVTQYEYNALDKLTKIITTDGKTSTYSYDALGRLTGKLDPDTDSSLFWYDAVGNLVKYQDARHRADGKFVSHKYDRISRLTSSWVHAGSDSILLVDNTYDNYGDFLTPEETSSMIAAGESLLVYNNTSTMDPNCYINISPASTSTSPNPIVTLTYSPLDSFPLASMMHATDAYIKKNATTGEEYLFNNDYLSVFKAYSKDVDAHYYSFIGFPFFYVFMAGDDQDSMETIKLRTLYGTALGANSVIHSAALGLYARDIQGPFTLKANVCAPLPAPEQKSYLLAETYYLLEVSIQSPINSAGWNYVDIAPLMQHYCEYTYDYFNYWCPQNRSFPSLMLSSLDNGKGATFYSGGAGNGLEPYLTMQFTSDDASPPQLCTLKIMPTHKWADLTWNFSNDWTIDTLEYGIAPNYNRVRALGEYLLRKADKLEQLEPGTQYNIRIIARDVTGNRSVYEGLTFTTDTLAFRHYKVHQLTPFSVRVSWGINYPDSIYVEYGSDQSCDRRTTPVFTYSDGFAFIDGLMPGKRYYFKIKSSGTGKVLSTAVHTFRTPGAIAFSNDPTGMLTRVRRYQQGEMTEEEVLGYDRLGRTSIRRLVQAGDGEVKRYFNYGYDQQDNLTYHMYPDGLFQLLNYDNYGRLASIKDFTGSTLASYTYTAAGACSTETMPNGVGTVYSYHPRLWLKNHTVKKGTSNLFRHWYQYDPVGNLTCDSYSSGKPEVIRELEYSYDALNRLKTEPGTVYQYDAMGNRLSAGTTTYQYYPNTNRLKSVNNGVNYQYDSSGNTTGDGVWTYAYDPMNKLARVSKGSSSNGTVIDYRYNANGLRVKSTKTVTTTQQAPEEKTLSEPYNDLVDGAPTGDGHDDARDLGQIKAHMNDNFLFFTVGHKYHYGASQGQYSHLYIAIDTDGQMGSGALDLPDSTGARVSADNAWEYCIYVNGDSDFGIYTKEGFRLSKPKAGNRKMTVASTPGSNGKYIIKVPVELLGSPKDFGFTAVTAKPGAEGETRVCDLSTAVAGSLEDGLISGSHQIRLNELDGGSSSTTTTEGFIYDGLSTACDLDENGQIVRKYLYANGKHLAMQTRSLSYGPYGNACEDTIGFSRGGDSAPIAINLNSDCAQGAWSVQVNVGAGNYGNFGFADQNIVFSANTYRYVHLWVKPLTPNSWLSFHCWDSAGSRWLGMNGDKDGNETFETGEDFVIGQWNEVWVDLQQNSQGFAGGPVRSFHMHSSPNSQFLIDGIYTVTQPWQTFYYHCDYLGSPRLMTDASGAVVWKQDYSAFGGDIGTIATGNTHKFTGHVQDGETGQYYAKARYFTTGLGRFSQPDPILLSVPQKKYLAFPQSLNPYLYCINNPLKYYDPDGLEYVFNEDGEDVTGTALFPDDQSAYVQTEKGLMYVGDMKGEVIIDQVFDKTIETNKKTAKELNAFEFKDKVQNKGEWDLKNRKDMIYGKGNELGTKFIYKSESFNAQDLGNYHYGAVGRSAGFPLFILQYAAGVAQKKDRTSKPEWQKGFLNLKYPFGDDPIDQQFIIKGFKSK